MRSGISALTKILYSTPHGGGSNSDCDALQEIRRSKVKSKLRKVTIGQLDLLRNDIKDYSILGLRTFGNTYKEARAHEHEPPPPSVMEF